MVKHGLILRICVFFVSHFATFCLLKVLLNSETCILFEAILIILNETVLHMLDFFALSQMNNNYDSKVNTKYLLIKLNLQTEPKKAI